MSKNIHTFYEIISSVLDISPEDINDDITYDTMVAWDSVNHFVLVTELESAFNISFDIEAISNSISIRLLKAELIKLGVKF